MNRRKSNLISNKCTFHKNIGDLRTNWAGEAYMSSCAKEKGLWFGTLNVMKAIHMKMENQMFGKQMFAWPFRDKRTPNKLISRPC